jgi:hypothetical protein
VRTLIRDNPALVHARERHNATGLYFAAAAGHRDTVIALLDAGAEINDRADVHELGVIGWTTFFSGAGVARDVLSLLLERGARHHIFSALALGDPETVRAVVEENPSALDGRMSRLEHRQTPLHFAITRGRPDLLELLIELGADVEAIDGNGQTPLEHAMLRGDDAAVSRLLAAGAPKPQAAPATGAQKLDARIGASVRKGVPILHVGDIAATLAWYTSIGFGEVGRYPDDGTALFWAMVSLGGAEVMFERGTADGKSVTMLFVTEEIQQLYDFLKSRQMQTVANATKTGSEAPAVKFVETLHEPVFGGLRFSIEDPNGYVLQFLQEAT